MKGMGTALCDPALCKEPMVSSGCPVVCELTSFEGLRYCSGSYELLKQGQGWILQLRQTLFWQANQEPGASCYEGRHPCIIILWWVRHGAMGPVEAILMDL